MTHELSVPARLEIHPVDVVPALTLRNRLTSGFRLVLALPHLVLVGGPVALGISALLPPEPGQVDWSAGGGLLGAA